MNLKKSLNDGAVALIFRFLPAAHVAPTAANLQSVHLIVVQSEDKLAKISKAANLYGASL